MVRTHSGFVFAALAMAWITGDYLARGWIDYAAYTFVLATLACLGAHKS